MGPVAEFVWAGFGGGNGYRHSANALGSDGDHVEEGLGGFLPKTFPLAEDGAGENAGAKFLSLTGLQLVEGLGAFCLSLLVSCCLLVPLEDRSTQLEEEWLMWTLVVEQGPEAL